ncbi:MAG: acyl-CoA dehydrogenase family protein [Thermoplasmatota archaeon]
MMDFDRTPDENEFIDNVRDVMERRIKPRVKEWRKAKTTTREFFRILGEEGLLGYRMKGDSIEMIPWSRNIYFYRELAEISGGLAIAAFVHSQTGNKAIHSFGNEYHRDRYLIPGIGGEKILGIANTEPGAGSDASAISLRAEDMGDHYLLNGSKSYITSGDIADAIVITAVTDPHAEKPHRGISMMVVDGDSPGLTRNRMDKIGWVESHLSTLNLEDVEVPKENLIGAYNRGFYQTMEVFNSSRIGIAATAMGSALGAFRMSFEYSNRRRIFGRTIFEHESKRSEFADRITTLQAAWLLIQKAAFRHDSGRDYSYNASMAKLFTTEEGSLVSHWAALNFGARGILEGYPVSQYPLDSNAALIGEGAPEVQRKIISENIEAILNDM